MRADRLAQAGDIAQAGLRRHRLQRHRGVLEERAGSLEAQPQEETTVDRSRGLGAAELRARPFDELSDAAWEREAAAGGARARPLRVVAKVPETDDAVTVLFEDPKHDRLTFAVGQHLTLELALGGERVRRSYSLAGTPGEPGLAITVKRVPSGVMSNHLHDGVRVGDVVRSFGPSGSFVAGEPPTGRPRRLLLVAGGSGIVPLAAIARDVLAREPDARVALIYGAASKPRAIYAGALDELARLHEDRFSLQRVLEAADGASSAVGRLDEAGLGPVLDALPAARFERVMLCGPDAMRAAARRSLEARGVDPGAIVEESFVSPRPARVSTEPQVATIVGDDGEAHAFPVPPGRTLLDAALDAGEAVPFSCTGGSCGACRVTLLDGQDAVALDEPNEVTPSDRAAGVVPACLARLNGPVRFAVGDGGRR